MGFKFLKGKAARKEIAKAEKRAANKQQEFDTKVFEFYLKANDSAKITFLDGAIDADDVLDIPVHYEHNLKLNGIYGNCFVCLGEDGPCPMCQDEDTPSLVGLLTIIDHRKYTDKNGKVHQHVVKLFKIKLGTIQILREYAESRGGLTGWTVKVKRSDKKMSPRVGDIFDFIKQYDVAKLIKHFDLEGIIDYEKVVPYYTLKQLQELGFGANVVGNELDDDDDDDDDDEKDLDDTDAFGGLDKAESGKEKKKKKGKAGKKNKKEKSVEEDLDAEFGDL